jgi:hypothetical protein
MGLALTFLSNSWISLIELSSRFIYSHDLYFTGSDVCFMISLYFYLIPCMIKFVNLMTRLWFRYSNVCSGMMSVHLESGGSVRDTRVWLINVDMVSGLISVARCGPIPWLVEVGGRW